MEEDEELGGRRRGVGVQRNRLQTHVRAVFVFDVAHCLRQKF